MVFTDDSLTSRNIAVMLKSMSDWQTLGIKLGLPDFMIEEIRINVNVYGIVQQRQRMITKWLEYDLNASWSKLADALEEMGSNKVAKDIRDKYVHGYRSKFTGGIRGIHLLCVIHSTGLTATVQVLIEVNK